MATMKALGVGILLATAAVSAWGQQSEALTAVAAPNSGTPNANLLPDDRPALQSRNPRYQVMRDDVLNITFPLSPELNQIVTVQPDGYITMQNVGSLYVQGMTVPEIQDALKKTYSKVLNNPIIDIDLKDFQKPFFVVSGQVAKPGQYDLRYDTTVSQAIAVASGLLPTARTQILIYHRVSPGMMEVRKFNLKDILDGKNVNEDALLKPGDMIFVPEKAITNFRKYVPYSLGLYGTLSPAMF
jgi:polysaccharide biosynthesis/export protein